MGDYTAYLIKDIIQHAGSAWDFELFCVRQYSQIEGFQFVPTSRNYDASIDGMLNKRRPNGQSYIIASMQEREILKKTMCDLKNLLTTDPRPGKVRICLAKLPSNAARLDILRAAKKKYKRVNIEVCGIEQIVEQVDRHSTAFADVYEHALDEARRQMEHIDRSSQPARRLGLRVLLSMQLEGTAIELRRNILRGLILQATPRDKNITEIELLRLVSDAVGLDRPIHKSYIAETLLTLQQQDFIEISQDGGIRRRHTSDNIVAEVEQLAASQIIDGYGSLKRALDFRLEIRIPNKAYKQIWEIIRKGLIDLFRTYGAEVIEFFYGVIDGKIAVTTGIPTNLLEGFQRIAEDLNTSNVSLPRAQRLQVMRVLPEALLDEETGTRRWTTRLCLAYLSACSLGLHPDALKRLEVQLRTWDIIPDTHVILSAIGRGEADHLTIRQLLDWWKISGGMLVLIDPVLEETYHHAQLAMRTVERWSQAYNRCRGSWRPTIPTNNVFLRSVAILRGDPGPSTVTNYLNQFLTSPHTDTIKLRKVLEEDCNSISGPKLQSDTEFENDLYRAISEIRKKDYYPSAEEEANADARCTRDAATLAYLSEYRKSLTDQRTAIILTHSTHLRKVCQDFQQHFGHTSTCIDPARLLFALSLNPGASFGLATIESALFGPKFQPHVAKHEDLARQVAEQFVSREHEILHTTSLQREVEERLIT